MGHQDLGQHTKASVTHFSTSLSRWNKSVLTCLVSVVVSHTYHRLAQWIKLNQIESPSAHQSGIKQTESNNTSSWIQPIMDTAAAVNCQQLDKVQLE